MKTHWLPLTWNHVWLLRRVSVEDRETPRVVFGTADTARERLTPLSFIMHVPAALYMYTRYMSITSPSLPSALHGYKIRAVIIKARTSRFVLLKQIIGSKGMIMGVQSYFCRQFSYESKFCSFFVSKKSVGRCKMDPIYPRYWPFWGHRYGFLVCFTHLIRS